MKINGIGSMGVNPYNLQANKLENVKSPYKANRDKLEISSAAKEMQLGSTIADRKTGKSGAT